MTKESKHHIENQRIIFSETFQDEQSVRRNGGTPTNVTFSNGVGTFSAVVEVITYPNIHLPTSGFSVRIIFRPVNVANTWYIASKYNGSNTGYVILQSLTALRFYVGGVGSNYAQVTVAADTWYEAVGVWDGSATKLYLNTIIGTNAVTPIPPVTYDGLQYIGAKYDNGSDFEGDIDLLEIYNYALTQSEIANMAGI